MIYLYFSILIILDSFMDFCNFYRKRNIGWICITTFDIRFLCFNIRWDAWHISKKLFWFILISGIVLIDLRTEGLYPYLILLLRAATLNLFIHEITLHKIFKRFTNYNDHIPNYYGI